MAKYREVFKDKNFFLYNIGQTFSQFADRLVHFAIIGFVYRIAPGSAMSLAKVMFFTLLPAFIVSPIAGVYVDRFPKKAILIAADILRAGIVLLISFFIISADNSQYIYAPIFLIFTCACFFLPAKLSMIPELVSEDKLLMANSAASVFWTVSGIIGFAAGAFLMEIAGLQRGLYINALMYALSSAAILFISSKNMKKNNHEAKKAKAFLHELKDGIVYLAGHSKARFVVGIFFLLMGITGALYVVSIVFIQEQTGSMTKDIGVFGLWLGMGYLAGAYVLGKKGGSLNKIRLVLLSLMAGGAFIMIFCSALTATRSIPVGCAVIFFTGAAIAPVMITANTIIHETIDENMRGRVFSSIGVIMNIGFILFMFSASYLAGKISRYWVIMLCGMLLVAIGAAGMVVDKKKNY